MKHLITSIAALVILSVTVQADDIKKNKRSRNRAVVSAPFVWGDPVDQAPEELMSAKTSGLLVPVAPFVWGDPDVLIQAHEKNKSCTVVPVAPFITGNPDEEISADVQTSLALQSTQ